MDRINSAFSNSASDRAEVSLPMWKIPESNQLPVHALAGGFRNVTNSYKFYWLLAILESIAKHREARISIGELSVEMVALVWYPVNYFHLSFGKQDKLSKAVADLIADSGLPIDASSDTIRTTFRQLSPGSKAVKTIAARTRYVPYRFLRPFFTAELRGTRDQEVNDKIKQLASNHFSSKSPPMYQFVGSDIELHPVWFEYLITHIDVVRGFCLWHLVLLF